MALHTCSVLQNEEKLFEYFGDNTMGIYSAVHEAQACFQRKVSICCFPKHAEEDFILSREICLIPHQYFKSLLNNKPVCLGCPKFWSARVSLTFAACPRAFQYFACLLKFLACLFKFLVRLSRVIILGETAYLLPLFVRQVSYFFPR